MSQPYADSTIDQRLEVFFGAATPAEARIYARLALSADEAKNDWQLAGQVIGPQCAFSQTLPARMPMLDRSAGAALLAETIVPDPCFWTPELPFLYRVQIELRCGNKLLSHCERTLGIRRLGVRGRSLNFEGKRFVLRARDCESQISNLKSQIPNLKLQIGDETAFLRESWTALVVPLPDDELCEFASRNGVLLVADLTGIDDFVKLMRELRRLVQWPAVGIALVGNDAASADDIHRAARNLLLAQYVAADQPVQLTEWADLALVETAEPKEFAEKTKPCGRPVIALRRLPQGVGIEAARTACDALQRDLAPYGDFAGYVV